LDRNGTLNAKAPEGSYVTTPRGLRLVPGAGGAAFYVHAPRTVKASAPNQATSYGRHGFYSSESVRDHSLWRRLDERRRPEPSDRELALASLYRKRRRGKQVGTKAGRDELGK
jgi:hypothetical protein